jgi:hypothetical protein
MPSTSLGISARRLLFGGTLAGSTSGAALLLGGRRDAGHAPAPLNAVAHWLWPVEALHENQASLRYTGSGSAIHFASSLLWAALYEGLRACRREPGPVNAVTDAVAVTTVAAIVDLKLVPQRLTPGFEHRLSGPLLFTVYAGFAAGLALAEWLTREPRRPRATRAPARR